MTRSARKRLAEQQVAASGGVDDLAGLLGEHRYRVWGRCTGCAWEAEEALDWDAPDHGPSDHQHRAHVADVIAREWLPERERAVRAEAWDEGCHEGYWEPAPVNPYREEQGR